MKMTPQPLLPIGSTEFDHMKMLSRFPAWGPQPERLDNKIVCVWSAQKQISITVIQIKTDYKRFI